MKYVWKVLHLMLVVAAIVLLVLWMTTGADNARLLGAGLLCSSGGTVVNLCVQRKARRDREKQENG